MHDTPSTHGKKIASVSIPIISWQLFIHLLHSGLYEQGRPWHKQCIAPAALHRTHGDYKMKRLILVATVQN